MRSVSRATYNALWLIGLALFVIGVVGAIGAQQHARQVSENNRLESPLVGRPLPTPDYTWAYILLVVGLAGALCIAAAVAVRLSGGPRRDVPSIGIE